MNIVKKPYCQACENNKIPILTILKTLFSNTSAVLEVGSGTGQHAVYFAEHLSHLDWYPSDRNENLDGIMQWMKDASLNNLKRPIELDVSQKVWPEVEIDAVFSANTVHIMHWPEVEALFRGISAILPTGGIFVLYGPMNFNGKYTSESNAEFDRWLKTRDPGSGIRDFETLNLLAGNNGMALSDDFEMPANNRILYWTKCN